MNSLFCFRSKLFFIVGKGGVGKTTFSCLHALNSATQFPTITTCLVSTDPAHSTRLALGKEDLPANLELHELAPTELEKKLMQRWRSSLLQIGSLGTFLDEQEIEKILNLALPSSEELLFFVELANMFFDEKNAYKRFVIDTAPTGHTLKLLKTGTYIDNFFEACATLLEKPKEMSRTFGQKNKTLEALDDFLQTEKNKLQRFSEILLNAEICEFGIVCRNEKSVLAETNRLVSQLQVANIQCSQIFINCIHAQNNKNAESTQNSLVDYELKNNDLINTTKNLLKFGLFELNSEPIGRTALENALLKIESIKEFRPTVKIISPSLNPSSLQFAKLNFQKIELMQLTTVCGKGGVGKTTTALAIAHAFAAQAGLSEKNSTCANERVLIVSTDPAHSLCDAIECENSFSRFSLNSNLDVWQLNSGESFQNFISEIKSEFENVLEAKSGNMALQFETESLNSLLEMSPPSMGEIFTLIEIATVLQKEPNTKVIIDTAPTGHFLSLLELCKTALEWLKEMTSILHAKKELFWLPHCTTKLMKFSRSLSYFSKTLAESAKCQFVVVGIPTMLSLEEVNTLLNNLSRFPEVKKHFIENRSDIKIAANKNDITRLKSLISQKSTSQTPVKTVSELNGIELIESLAKEIFYG